MTRRAVIAGGGTMGVGVVAVFLAGGWDVQVIESASAPRRALTLKVAACLEQCPQPRHSANALFVVSALADIDWTNVELVVECLPEKLEIKQSFFADLEQAAPIETILASNSSSFPISNIAQGLKTTARMTGLHFFMPAHLVPLVEVISSEATDAAVAETLCEIMQSLGKRPVHVRKDVPGFLANRIQHALMREALSLAEHGIATPEDIDIAIQYSFGMRFMGAGPFCQKDLAGLDIHNAAATTIYPTLCNDTEPSDFLKNRVAAGNVGVKTGRGFFDWNDEKTASEKQRYDRALIAALKIMHD